MRRYYLVLSILFVSAFLLSPLYPGQLQNIDEFISDFQESLEQKEIQSYLSAFSPQIQKKEEERIRDVLNRLKIDTISVFSISKSMEKEDEANLYLNIFFQNSYSVIVERWDMSLLNIDGGWQITEKNIVGESNRLYKINLPSSRSERVKLFEVNHVDITLTFKDSFVFYDNIPEIETALLVVGKGELSFSPSASREKHQLELIYKKKFLKDELNYAYLRFSNAFFQSNVNIIKDEENTDITPSEEQKIAHSLFKKHYSRSFTIENSLTEGLLSFLPQGTEAVFGFQGKKIGDYSYIYSPNAPEEVNLYQWEKKRIINLYSPDMDDGKKKLVISFGPKFDIKNYQIDIDFDPDKFYLSGKARIEIQSKINFLDAVKFRVNNQLEILRIIDSDGRDLFYTKDKLRNALYIYFLRPCTREETTAIDIYYRGKLVPLQVVSDVLRGPRQEEIFVMLPHRYETHLYSRSSLWYPTPFGEDYFTANLKVIVPPGYSVVSNGLLVDRTELKRSDKVEDLEKEGGSVNTFETKKPVKYLSFLVGKLIKIDQTDTPVFLQFFRSKDSYIQRKGVIDDAKKILQFFVSRFGPYPYEKLTIINRLWSTSGGHSPASFIILNEIPRSSDRRRYNKPVSPVGLYRWKEYFMAHEIAHQWWGQGVAWDSYHDHWLSEGLAQFSAVLYLRELYGDKAFSSILKKLTQWTEKKTKWGSITMGSRISHFDFEAYQSIIYNKTSLVLNMLRDLLGDDLFFKGLKKFFSENVYSAAKTSDFKRCFEDVSGKNLKVFFDMWFESYHLPDTKITHSVDREGRDYLLKIEAVQLKDNFVFPLWIEWVENKNKVRKKLIIEKESQEFTFRLRNKPTKIKINPDSAIPGNFHW